MLLRNPKTLCAHCVPHRVLYSRSGMSSGKGVVATMWRNRNGFLGRDTLEILQRHRVRSLSPRTPRVSRARASGLHLLAFRGCSTLNHHPGPHYIPPRLSPDTFSFRARLQRLKFPRAVSWVARSEPRCGKGRLSSPRYRTCLFTADVAGPGVSRPFFPIPHTISSRRFFLRDDPGGRYDTRLSGDDILEA